jgi:hypothetical protein
MKNSRREFVKLSGMAGLSLGLSGLDSWGPASLPVDRENEINFLSPIDGDMLCTFDGIETSGGLITKVSIRAPKESRINVNGVNAQYSNGIFQADINLTQYENELELVDQKTGFREKIKIYRLKNFAKHYRLSMDDNIWFLKDLHLNSDVYKSIFENPYLSFLKQVHDTYGTKIHLNIYYETDGFNISQLSDKFKAEWKANTGWLHLSFHARADKPDKPYLNSGYEKMKKDCDLVMEQICRFAGTEVTAQETTLHWGEATTEGCRALRDAGFKCLPCDFNVDNDLPPCSYYLDIEKRRHINKRLIWRDNREDIIFIRCAIIINTVELEKIVPFLDDLKKDPHMSAYVDLLMHEQYFYPYYEGYQPDYRQKVMTAVKWAKDNGYKPAFLSECVFE